MSFREIKGFVEQMRMLGFPRLISLENFRTPNFPLVCEILQWLCTQIDSSHGINRIIDTQHERVIFITSVCQFLNNKLTLKLNAKRLYQADNMAVREMLQVSTILCDSLKLINKSSDNEISEFFPIHGLKLEKEDLKKVRQLASEITSKGAIIFDFLSKEVELRENRNQVLEKNLEIDQIESALRKEMNLMEEDIRQTQEAMDNIATSEAALDQKIEKRTAELQRMQKRLETMKKIRPAFMDEFEKLESELRLCYEDYVNKFRCLAFLEQQWHELEKREQQQLDERQAAARKMAERLRQEETLQALEAAVGGDWGVNDELEFFPDEAAEHSGEGNQRTGTKKNASLSDSDLDEQENVGLEGDGLSDSESDVTLDEWQHELNTWQVGSKMKTRKSTATQRPINNATDDF